MIIRDSENWNKDLDDRKEDSSATEPDTSWGSEQGKDFIVDALVFCFTHAWKKSQEKGDPYIVIPDITSLTGQ